MRHNISEVTELIKDRRTITPENFSDRKVHKEIVTTVLNNALWAPTHGRTEPWFFKVFLSEESRKELSEYQSQTYKELTSPEDFNERKFNKLKNRPLKASVVVAICMKKENEKILEVEEIEAVACAVQNIHLTCTAYGLGGFWATPKLIYRPEMNTFLGLGEKDKCLGLFYIGYPSVEWPKSHRKPLEYKSEWL